MENNIAKEQFNIIIEEAKNVFDKEIKALTLTREAIGHDFEIILKLILECEGKVVITGMGKPGHIGAKIAATFASLGTPSFFMHPGRGYAWRFGDGRKKGCSPPA